MRTGRHRLALLDADAAAAAVGHHHASAPAVVLLAAAVAEVWLVACLARPVMPCPACGGRRVIVRGRRARRCKRCRGTGLACRRGAVMVHRFCQRVRDARRREIHNGETMGHPDGAHTHGHGGGLVELAVAAAGVVGLALAAAVAVAFWRPWRRARVAPWQPGVLAASRRPQVAPREVHLHLHSADAAGLAAILGHAAASPVIRPGQAGEGDGGRISGSASQ